MSQDLSLCEQRIALFLQLLSHNAPRDSIENAVEAVRRTHEWPAALYSTPEIWMARALVKLDAEHALTILEREQHARRTELRAQLTLLLDRLTTAKERTRVIQHACDLLDRLQDHALTFRNMVTTFDNFLRETTEAIDALDRSNDDGPDSA